MERLGGALEDRDVRDATERDDEAERRVTQQRSRVGEREPLRAGEQMAKAVDRAVDGVADDRRQQCRDEHFRLEVWLSVENFGGEDGSREWRTKDRADAGGDARHHEYALLLLGEMKRTCEEAPESRTDLRDGTFATGAATGAERQCRGHQLHEWRLPRDIASAAVIGADRGIGAVSRCVGCESVDEQRAQQATDRRCGNQSPDS